MLLQVIMDGTILRSASLLVADDWLNEDERASFSNALYDRLGVGLYEFEVPDVSWWVALSVNENGTPEVREAYPAEPNVRRWLGEPEAYSEPCPISRGHIVAVYDEGSENEGYEHLIRLKP